MHMVATSCKCWCFHNAGEVVGALSFSVGHGSSVLKKVASVRMVHQTNDVHNIVPYTLKKRVSFVEKLSSGCSCKNLCHCTQPLLYTSFVSSLF